MLLASRWSAADAVPRLRHEAIFLLVFALDLVNMFIATVAYPALAAELHAEVSTLAWWAPPICWA